MQTLPIAIELWPEVGPYRRQFRAFCSKLALLPKELEAARLQIENLRANLTQDSEPLSTDRLRLAFVSHVLLDLQIQGWTVEVDDGVVLKERLEGDESAHESKSRIRNQHLEERNAQLREDSVVEFIKSMERRRLTSQGWHSIFSVMRDGEELAGVLTKVRTIHDPMKRQAALARTIDPYIEFVDSKATCKQTGLKLNDIWRYFRHSWTTVYKSVPGRSMAILIRDRARPNHPVIGIAALGSSVVQQAVRDKWVGWDKESASSLLCDDPSKKRVRRLMLALDGLIKEVYKADLLEEGLLTRWAVKRPLQQDIDRLSKASLKAIESHRLYPNTVELKNTNAGRVNDWKKLARTTLFRSKRCKQLALLLSIRLQFESHSIDRLPLSELRKTMRKPSVRKAVGQLIRLMKAERVGINMMDITVCGAVAPYNPILGGKLVCLLLCSPEVVQGYRERYKNHVSVIASSMAAKEIHRDPQLVLMATTSLYGVGSSQYNRLKVSADLVGGVEGESIGFLELGKSEGFGSFHFSKETVKVAQALLGRLEGGRKVNSIFGEGVNPLMRKLREALNAVNLPSELLLKHGNRRIIYAVPLARNFRNVLMGIDQRASYIIPAGSGSAATSLLAEYWRQRWLDRRIDSDSVLAEVDKHRLSYPIVHGARITLAEDAGLI
jgi:hypothetical protein